MIWFGNYFYFTWGKGFSVVAIYDPLAIQNTNFDYKMQEFPNFTITTWRVEFLLTKCQNAYIVSQKWKIMRNFINSFFWEYKKNLNVTGGWNPIEHDIIIKLWLNSSLVMSAMIRQKKKKFKNEKSYYGYYLKNIQMTNIIWTLVIFGIELVYFEIANTIVKYM